MTTVSAGRRDPAELREGLVRWLRTSRPDAEDVRVGPLRKPASGWSSDTFMLDVVWVVGGEERQEPLVVRLPPAGGGIFPAYDLSRQATAQAALSTTSIPVARPVAVELDETWVGAPFLLMERAFGFTLPDNPSYVAGGALHDAGVEIQSKVQHDFVSVLADIHRLDYEAVGLGSLTPAGERGLVHDVDRADNYLQWAADGDPPPILVDGVEFCRANRPSPDPPMSLLWGDPRIGNVVYDVDFRQVALLDWEMAAIGPAEMDLSWFLALHESTVTGLGSDLPGFAPPDEVTAAYARRLGREVRDHHWFEVLSLLRADSIYLRIRRMLLASGLDEPWLRGTTPGQRRIETLVHSWRG